MATENPPRGADGKWRQDLFDSDALRKNLEETAVDGVTIDPKYEVLRETVADYRGIVKTLDSLLYELNHPYKNWEIILPELRSFSLKHFGAYSRHPKGPRAVAVILDIFLDAVMNSGREDLQARAIEHLLSYLEKIIAELNAATEEAFLPVLSECFGRLSSIPENRLFLMASSHVPLKRIGQNLLRKVPAATGVSEFNRLLVRNLRAAYGYWLKEQDPREWFPGTPGEKGGNGGDLLEAVSHSRLKGYMDSLDRLASADGSVETLQSLLALPGYLEIVRAYREVPHSLETSEKPEDDGDPLANLKILSLFKIMEIPGLKDIHEETLREINFTLVNLLRKGSPEKMGELLVRTFTLLKSNAEDYPQTALQCIQAIGAEVFNREYSP
ncbi:MAG TPA: phosphoenolpyruvate synthase, partial [Thermodesulfobacteriota bacterium]|nr:phosphoenolpyruvate synthase [Thermodesulfobacteriota bacterium]